jgi:hypothetical protein
MNYKVITMIETFYSQVIEANSEDEAREIAENDCINGGGCGVEVDGHHEIYSVHETKETK